MTQAKIPSNIFIKYPGKRVALVEGKVIAVSSNSADAYHIAQKKYPHKKISLFSVPRKEDKYLLV